MNKNKAVLLMLAIAMSGCADRPTAVTPATPPTDAAVSPPGVQPEMDASTRSKLREILALRAGWPAAQPHGRTVDLISREFRHALSRQPPDRLAEHARAVGDRLPRAGLLHLHRLCGSAQHCPQRRRVCTTSGRHSLRRRQNRLPAAQTLLHRLAQRPHQVAEDITAQLSPHAVTLVKTLNRKADGSSYLPGLPVAAQRDLYPQRQRRQQGAGPAAHGRLHRYLHQPDGLDVTHTGIFVMTDSGPVLRNASSRKANMRVVDSPFMDYVMATPGIVVLRSLSR